MLDITQKLLPNRPKTKLKELRGLVVHYTFGIGRSCTADSWTSSWTGSVGAHYSIDANLLVQYVPDDEKINHAGGSPGPTQVVNTLFDGHINEYTVGLEICICDGQDYPTIEKRAIQFCGDFLKSHNLTTDNMWRHFDSTTKPCPVQYLEKDKWYKFIDEVKKYMDNQDPKKIENIYKTDDEFRKFLREVHVYDAQNNNYWDNWIWDWSKQFTPDDRGIKSITHGKLNIDVATVTISNIDTPFLNKLFLQNIQSAGGDSGHCIDPMNFTNGKLTVKELCVEPIYPDLTANPSMSSGLFNDMQNVAEQNTKDNFSTIITTDEYEKRQKVFDANKYKDETKKDRGKIINNNDPYNVDTKIKQLEQHLPKLKIDTFELKTKDCNHPGCAMGAAVKTSLTEITDVITEISMRAEKRIVAVENILSVLLRNTFKMASRVNINCVYYGGQDQFEKYNCIRCLNTDRISDGQSVSLDQCLACTRYEPILGQIYDILDNTGKNLSQVLDDTQMAYMSMDDYINLTRTEKMYDSLKDYNLKEVLDINDKIKASSAEIQKATEEALKKEAEIEKKKQLEEAKKKKAEEEDKNKKLAESVKATAKKDLMAQKISEVLSSMLEYKYSVDDFMNPNLNNNIISKDDDKKDNSNDSNTVKTIIQPRVNTIISSRTLNNNTSNSCENLFIGDNLIEDMKEISENTKELFISKLGAKVPGKDTEDKDLFYNQISNKTAKKIFTLFGYNDLIAEEDINKYILDYTDYVTFLKSTFEDGQIFVIGIPKCIKPTDVKNPIYEKANENLKSLCLSTNIKFIDTNTLMSDFTTGRAPDGMYWNTPKDYKPLLEVIRKFVLDNTPKNKDENTNNQSGSPEECASATSKDNDGYEKDNMKNVLRKVLITKAYNKALKKIDPNIPDRFIDKTNEGFIMDYKMQKLELQQPNINNHKYDRLDKRDDSKFTKETQYEDNFKDTRKDAENYERFDIKADNYDSMFPDVNTSAIGGIGSIAGSELRQKILAKAKEIADDPNIGYSQTIGGGVGVKQSDGKSYYDCSGFAQACYAAAGLTLNRTSQDQYRQCKENGSMIIELSNEKDAKPGDLIFYYMGGDGPGHVAIYAGNHQQYAASTDKKPFQDQILLQNIYDGAICFGRISELVKADAQVGGSNIQGTIDGVNYIYVFKQSRVTNYDDLGQTATSGVYTDNKGTIVAAHNLPSGTEIYIPSLKGKVNNTGIFTVYDTGGPVFDFDINTTVTLDRDEPRDVYIIKWGTGAVLASFEKMYSTASSSIRTVYDKYKGKFATDGFTMPTK